jgi:hypothetical protein
VTSGGDQIQTAAALPDLNLCVMNPPFARSVGGNLLFGSIPPDDRKPMQEDLKRLVQSRNVDASITAGLGGVFVAAADRYVKPAGRIALVLPRALLSGVAWEKTRELVAKHYCLEYLVVSHEPNHWNFSENTDLSEVLVVAQKMDTGAAQASPTRQVVCVNLWKNPTTVFEGLAAAHALTTGEPPDVELGQGALEVRVGEEKLGEAVSVP